MAMPPGEYLRGRAVEQGITVIFRPPNPKIDIVVVHGFRGSPYASFIHPVNPTQNEEAQSPTKRPKLEDVYWPRDLLPLTIPDGRVLTYGYDSSLYPKLFSSRDGCGSLQDLGWNMLVGLEAKRRRDWREDPRRPIIFVAHSLGGLVVKETLRRSSQHQKFQRHLHSVFESTRGIIFFGTPHRGGIDPDSFPICIDHWLAGRLLTVDRQIKEVMLPESEVIRDLNRAFNLLVLEQGWMIHSFQEQGRIHVLLSKVKVVGDSSSVLDLPFNEVTERITRNHSDMCRFPSRDDTEYRKFEAAVSMMVKHAYSLERPSSGLNSPQQQKDRLLGSLNSAHISALQPTVKRAHPCTCHWLLSKSEYLEWLDSEKILQHHGFLMVKGKPRTGKSTLMKFALNNPQWSEANDNIVISFFFNAQGEDLERTTAGMYRTLLYQLLESLPLGHVVYELPIIKLHGRRSVDWDIGSLEEAFEQVVRSLERESLVCFIDALNECNETEVRDMVSLFERLGKHNTPTCPTFRVCFSSRHYPNVHIEDALELVLEDLEEHEQDISGYVLSELKIVPGDLANEIRDEVRRRAAGIFMWVVLTTQILNRAYHNGKVDSLHRILEETPTDLDKLFRDVVKERHSPQSRAELRLCLLWVLFSSHPLTPTQLYFAIRAGTEPELSTTWDPHKFGLPDMGRSIKAFINHASKGLTEIASSNPPIVRFIHDTVEDFLLSGGGLHEILSDCQTDFLSDNESSISKTSGHSPGSRQLSSPVGTSHDMLKSCCVSYFKEVNTLLRELLLARHYPDEANKIRESTDKRLPFLGYAVQNILSHAEAAAAGNVDQESFLDDFPKILQDWVMWNNVFQPNKLDWYPTSTRLLYLLAEQNCASLIEACKTSNDSFTVGEERYGAPILAALAMRNGAAVQALVKAKVRTLPTDCPFTEAASQYRYAESDTKVPEDFRFLSDNTLPFCLAQYGDAMLVALSLVDSYPDTLIGGQTALCWAAEGGHIDIVRFLLERRASRVPAGMKPPVALAARNGHMNVVKLFLLESGRDREMLAQAALAGAVEGGRDELVELLLQDAKPNSTIDCVPDPFLTAVALGHHGLAHLLLERGADVNVKSRDDWTALHLVGNHANMAVELLRHGAELNAKDVEGRTPLSWAAERGCESTFRLLLEHDANTGVLAEGGRTPLLLAAEAGYEAIVRMLLEKEVDKEARDDQGQTALSLAARYGNRGVVEVLLNHGAQVSTRDKCGLTPLWHAVGDGDESVVRLLLENGAATEVRNQEGLTPLGKAVILGNEQVVKVLLDFGADVKARTELRRKPIDFARHFEMDGIVELLREYSRG